jgi:hypothetical protein
MDILQSHPESSALLDKFLGGDDELENDEEIETTDEAADGSEEGADEGAADEAEEGSEEADDEASEAEKAEEAKAQAAAYAADDQKVKLKDGTEVTIAELKEGSLRHSDYTRKTQELGARAAKVQQYEDALTLGITIALSTLPDEPTDEMLRTSPVKYIQQKELRERAVNELAHMVAAQKGMQEQSQAEQAEAEQAHLIEEAQKVRQLFPEFSDPAKVAAFQKDMEAVGAKYGFTDMEVQDHRYLLLAKDLIEYHKILANKPKALEKVKGKPPLSATNRQAGKNTSAGDMEKLRKSNGRDKSALDRILDKFV